MNGRSVDGEDRGLIDAKYRQKIEAFARRQPDLGRCEAEQLFLLHCRRAAEQFEGEPTKAHLRQVAWRSMTSGPGAAERDVTA